MKQSTQLSTYTLYTCTWRSLVITVAVEYVFGTTSDAPQYSPFFSGFSGGFNDLPRRPAGIGSESR